MKNSEEKVDPHQKPIKHKCHKCGVKFKEKRKLVDHVTDIHMERKVCSFKRFNRHLSRIYRAQGENPVCCNCGKKMSSKQSLTNHEERCIRNLIG